MVDAAGLRYTDSHAVHRGQPIAMMGLRVDVLSSGCRYDLASRTGIPPADVVRIDPLTEEELAEEEADEVPVGDVRLDHRIARNLQDEAVVAEK